uniref:Uncharacterized protein n=1 Tax=Poecilia formosa TaxID=48698 RepID=A0A087Y111_POEFO
KAHSKTKLEQEAISCSICLNPLKRPVTIACGHSYCMRCINLYWNGEDHSRVYICPQCRQSFTPRSILVKSTMLVALVEQLKETGLGKTPADHCYAGPEDVACDVCSWRKMKAVKSCLVCLVSYCKEHLQPHYKSAFDKHKLVDPSKMLQENICPRHDEAMKIFCRTDQRVKDVQEKLEQEITELKRKDAELEQLSHTEDHTQFLLNSPSLPALRESTPSSSVKICPLRHFEDVTAAVSELRDKLQKILTDPWTNISLTVNEVDVQLSETEPKTRDEFLKCLQEITLDPNTAHRNLLLSEGNSKVTSVDKQQFYSDHPNRFTEYYQVLSNESLTGRCYWEVEWSGGLVYVAVSNKNISRGGGFGLNNKSWTICCTTDKYTFHHKGIPTPVPGPVSSRIGVYLDQTAGILSFYGVSETMTLLHRVQTSFTQPLYAGICLFGDSSAEFIKLK